MKEISQKKFWQSTNFWTAVILVIGGLFVGFEAEIADQLVNGAFMLIAGGMGVRNLLKTPQIDFKGWLNNSNVWNYIGTIVVAIIPMVPQELIGAVQELLQQFLGGNFQGILVAAFSLFTIIYNVFIKPKPGPKTAT